jgi:ubiquinone/menaquinone biosynthesis C-methylase UbiE
MGSGQFDRWSGTYDDSALQPAYQAAHEAVLDALPRQVEPVRLLDIGCGTGRLLARLATAVAAGSVLVGIDASAGMLRAARDRVGCLVGGMAEALPFAEATFDLVVSTASFRHWSEPGLSLREIRRVLVEDGVAVIADLDPGPLDLVASMVRADLDVVEVAKIHGYGPVALVAVATGRRRCRHRWRIWPKRGSRGWTFNARRFPASG